MGPPLQGKHGEMVPSSYTGMRSNTCSQTMEAESAARTRSWPNLRRHVLVAYPHQPGPTSLSSSEQCSYLIYGIPSMILLGIFQIQATSPGLDSCGYTSLSCLRDALSTYSNCKYTGEPAHLPGTPQASVSSASFTSNGQSNTNKLHPPQGHDRECVISLQRRPWALWHN